MNQVRMFAPYVNETARKNVDAVLRSGWIGEGDRVQEFEEKLCAKFGFPYAVATNSGTAALEIALALAGVGPGDEVISTAMTCTATNMPILRAGAKVVFADVDYFTGNINPLDIEHRITERTKAIVAVHWAGLPCDMGRIHKIANYHDLSVIEDAAHALGAEIKIDNVRYNVGGVSQFTAFSFQAIKSLTTGDGGLLVVHDVQDYDAARRLRWFGIDRRNRQPGIDGYSRWPQIEVGFKAHMNDIAAAIGLGNLEDFDAIMLHRSEIANRYYRELQHIEEVRLFSRPPGWYSSHWLFTMHVQRRDDFCRAMRDRGVDVSVCHIRNDEHPIFGPKRRDLPTLDQYAETHISIPLHSHLTGDDVDQVIAAVKAGW